MKPMRASGCCVLLLGLALGWSSSGSAFVARPGPLNPSASTTTTSSSGGRRAPLPAPSAQTIAPWTGASCTVRRHFMVGGDPAADTMSLQETFNAATAMASLVVGGLVALELYQERPRGWVNEALVDDGPSTLGPQAGRGLFAAQDIPKGTVLGSYPGMIYPKAQWLAKKDSEEALLFASRYSWTLATGDKVLDPTLPNGALPDVMVALGGVIRKPTLLALINEPPAGIDINLLPEITDTEVTFVAERDIFKGEELFIDYGPEYNRMHYGRRR